MLHWQENVALAPYTTIQLGGPARYFVAVQSVEELQQALREAAKKKIRVHILAGGSNTVFADAGFDGLAIKIDLKGVEFVDDGDQVVIVARAGEVWESLAEEAVRRDLAGFECLAGIPGSVGGTPVQNVGAYGQEVSQTITEVTALDRQTFEPVKFSNAECQFSYRMSRFKGKDSQRFVIVAVTYRLRKGGAPTLVYQPVIDQAGENPTLQNVRAIVLALRKHKSMMLDPTDPHTRSCGSFFTNPILAKAELKKLAARAQNIGDVPQFPRGDDTVTIPAAWLIEHSGWRKGLRRGGVGISDNHPLALVNYGGTTAALLALADDIQTSVSKKFGIELVREPVVV